MCSVAIDFSTLSTEPLRTSYITTFLAYPLAAHISSVQFTLTEVSDSRTVGKQYRVATSQGERLWLGSAELEYLSSRSKSKSLMWPLSQPAKTFLVGLL